MIPTDTAATESVSGCWRNRPRRSSAGERVVQRHVAAADGRGPGPAVGLQDVAVHGHLHLAQGDHVAHRPQRATDEPLDLLRPSRLPAAGRLA